MSSSSSLALNRLHTQLREASRLTRVHHPGFYSAFDRIFAVQPRERKVSQKHLDAPTAALLSTYFAVHGSVHIRRSKNGYCHGPLLSISKRAALGEILHLYQEHLGGRIIVGSKTHNLLELPLCVWYTSGEEALRLSSFFASKQSPMQEKLLVLAKEPFWPQESSHRAALKRELEERVWNTHNFLEIRSFLDFAVLFDVSGILLLHGAAHNRMRLSITCPSFSEFEQLTTEARSFLGSSLSPYLQKNPREPGKGRSSCTWCISDVSAIRDLLTGMMPLLQLKRREARAALSISSSGGFQNMVSWYQTRPPDMKSAVRLRLEYHELLGRLSSRRVLLRQAWGSEERRKALSLEVDELKLRIQEVRWKSEIDWMSERLVNAADYVEGIEIENTV